MCYEQRSPWKKVSIHHIHVEAKGGTWNNTTAYAVKFQYIHVEAKGSIQRQQPMLKLRFQYIHVEAKGIPGIPQELA